MNNLEYISPTSRPGCYQIYTTIITDMQNPVQLRFRYRQEAERYQKLFHHGLMLGNELIFSEINYSPTREYKEQILLTFWK